jgi:hypothetical protein
MKENERDLKDRESQTFRYSDPLPRAAVGVTANVGVKRRSRRFISSSPPSFRSGNAWIQALV